MSAQELTLADLLAQLLAGQAAAEERLRAMHEELSADLRSLREELCGKTEQIADLPFQTRQALATPCDKIIIAARPLPQDCGDSSRSSEAENTAVDVAPIPPSFDVAQDTCSSVEKLPSLPLVDAPTVVPLSVACAAPPAAAPSHSVACSAPPAAVPPLSSVLGRSDTMDLSKALAELLPSPTLYGLATALARELPSAVRSLTAAVLKFFPFDNG